MAEREKKNQLYLECASGISGDMFAAAMLDLGADRKALERALDSIPEKGFRTEISRVKKASIDCCDFNVVLDQENHDHDMNYLFGREDHAEDPHGYSHGSGEVRTEHSHEDTYHHSFNGEQTEHVHPHEEEHGHHHTHSHAHRTLQDIRRILSAVDMTEGAYTLAEKIFRILVEAEAEAHGSSPGEVHLHEAGGLDSIVDIISAAVCFDSLDIGKVYVKKMFEGSGTIRCAHGILPVPVPAVVNIAGKYGLPVSISEEDRGEFITPTGAAITAAIATDFNLPDVFIIRKTGLGAGKRTYERPSFLRAMLIEPRDEKGSAPAPENAEEGNGQKDPSCSGTPVEDPMGHMIWKLETDIDDCSGEVLGYVTELLYNAGAREVHYGPVFMKKNRPGWTLTVLCSEERREVLEGILFRETTTIGIRRVRMERTVLSRKEGTAEAFGEAIRIKICGTAENTRCYPEFESVKTAAEKTGRTFLEVYREAQKKAVEKNR